MKWNKNLKGCGACEAMFAWVQLMDMVVGIMTEHTDQLLDHNTRVLQITILPNGLGQHTNLFKKPPAHLVD